MVRLALKRNAALLDLVRPSSREARAIAVKLDKARLNLVLFPFGGLLGGLLLRQVGVTDIAADSVRIPIGRMRIDVAGRLHELVDAILAQDVSARLGERRLRRIRQRLLARRAYPLRRLGLRVGLLGEVDGDQGVEGVGVELIPVGGGAYW